MTPPTQSPTQIAWVTPDLDATEKALTGLLGVRKWVRIPDVHFAPDACSYLGKPADFVASISLSYLGDMQLELISPVRGQNIYSDHLRDSGPGLHHICIEAESSGLAGNAAPRAYSEPPAQAAVVTTRASIGMTGPPPPGHSRRARSTTAIHAGRRTGRGSRSSPTGAD